MGLEFFSINEMRLTPNKLTPLDSHINNPCTIWPSLFEEKRIEEMRFATARVEQRDVKSSETKVRFQGQERGKKGKLTSLLFLFRNFEFLRNDDKMFLFCCLNS